MTKIISYIYDFLSMVFEEKKLIENINEVILFGSIAKGTYDKKSDIDLFFDIKNTKEITNIEENLIKILKSFEIKADKTWALKKISFPINFIVGSLDDKTWEKLKDEIISSGIILYGKYKEMPSNTKHNFLFYYSLDNLERKNKMKFIRGIFGYILNKDKKKYIQEGLLEKIKGTKIASNVILIPSNEILKIKNFFKEHKVKYKILETWIRL